MRKILRSNTFRVISEPGDMTRYDFLVTPVSPSVYKIQAHKSTFTFPKFVDLNIIGQLDTVEKCAEFLEHNNDLNNFKKVNPHTLLECIKSVRKIRFEYEGEAIRCNEEDIYG